MKVRQSRGERKPVQNSARVVLLGRFTTNVGLFMVMPFLAVNATQQAGLTSMQTGALLAALQFTRRGLGIPAGWASDRFGAARTLTVGLLIEAAAYLAFAAAGSGFWAWLVAASLLGAGGALNNNGSRTIVAAGASGGVASALSRYYVSINAAALIGPLIGAALQAGGFARVGFTVAAALHVVFAAATAALLRGMPRPAAASVRASDMAVALRDRPLMLYCGLIVGCWFLVSQYRVALPLTIVHQGLSSAVLGPLTILNAVVAMVAVSLIARRIDRYGTSGSLNALSLSGIVLGGGWLLCVLPGAGPIVAAVIVTSVGESLFCGVVDAIVAGLAPPGRLSLYLGYSTMAWGVGAVLAGLVGGGFDAAARHGVLPVFWCVMAAVGIVTAVGVRLARRQLADAVSRRQDHRSASAHETARTG